MSAQVAAEEDGLRATARVLRAPGGPRAAAFAPTLAARVPRDAAGFLALPGLDAMAAIAERAGGAALLAGLEERAADGGRASSSRTCSRRSTARRR